MTLKFLYGASLIIVVLAAILTFFFCRDTSIKDMPSDLYDFYDQVFIEWKEPSKAQDMSFSVVIGEVKTKESYKYLLSTYITYGNGDVQLCSSEWRNTSSRVEIPYVSYSGDNLNKILALRPKAVVEITIIHNKNIVLKCVRQTQPK